MTELLKALKGKSVKWRHRLNEVTFGKWMLDQQVPLQSINRTILDYEIHWFDRHEFYDPGGEFPETTVPANTFLLHHLPQALPRPYYFFLEDAVVCGHAILDPRNMRRVFLENYPEVSRYDEGQNWYFDFGSYRAARRRAKTPGSDLERGFVFSSRWWNNYYHFIVDSCLRYVNLERVGAICPDTSILLHDRPNRWQSEYLELLQIPAGPGNIPLLESGQALRIGRLTIASSRRHRFVCSPQALRALKARLLDAADVTAKGGGRRIYISRRAAGQRQILNEDEVRVAAERHGFETFVLEDLPVRSQIRLFAEADTILAPHGAGLTNMLYADRPTVIELLPSAKWYLGYFVALANGIGGKHVPVFSTQHERASDDRQASRLDKWGDFRVDIAALEAVL